MSPSETATRLLAVALRRLMDFDSCLCSWWIKWWLKWHVNLNTLKFWQPGLFSVRRWAGRSRWRRWRRRSRDRPSRPATSDARFGVDSWFPFIHSHSFKYGFLHWWGSGTSRACSTHWIPSSTTSSWSKTYTSPGLPLLPSHHLLPRSWSGKVSCVQFVSWQLTFPSWWDPKIIRYRCIDHPWLCHGIDYIH